MEPILNVADLSVTITLPTTMVHAAGNIDLHVGAGETLGLVASPAAAQHGHETVLVHYDRPA